MNYKKIIPIIVGILLLLAIALGIIQRKNSPELDSVSTKPTQSLSQTVGKTLSEYYETGQEIKKDSPAPATTFLAGGDISLSRNIALSIDKAKDTNFPFRNIEKLLSSTDFNFANLETPFSSSDAYTAKNTLVFNAPKKNVEGLVKNNFKIVNLANNHALDQGYAGVKTTKEWLTQNNILSVGTGVDLASAWEPEIVTSNGIRIGFIGASYSSVNDGGKVTNNYVARMDDSKRLDTAIRTLRATGVDYIVVTMHGGTEYTRTPNAIQKEFAHTAVDLGADMVIGAHPHWVQTIEKYKGNYIFYSLGNFVFDQNWSKETTEGLLLKISLEKEGQAPGSVTGNPLQGNPTPAHLTQIELLPIIIEGNSSPRLATTSESTAILKQIKIDTTVLYP